MSEESIVLAGGISGLSIVAVAYVLVIRPPEYRRMRMSLGGLVGYAAGLVVMVTGGVIFRAVFLIRRAS